jgi:hypothetical protein
VAAALAGQAVPYPQRLQLFAGSIALAYQLASECTIILEKSEITCSQVLMALCGDETEGWAPVTFERIADAIRKGFLNRENTEDGVSLAYIQVSPA